VDNGAVVVMYHRFGDGRYPSTNIRMEQFRKHVAELKKDKYTVMPLPEIVSALRNDRPLPDRAVAITVDDAYLSVYENAWPILREAGFPFTLFVATQPVDAGMKSYMSWDQLRAFAESDLVTIGSQTHNHPHMPAQSLEANRQELSTSQARFRAELGREPDLFAYPYGEYAAPVKKAVREAGFVAAFGQHSGALGRLSDMYALPRYALNEAYGDMDRFTLAVNSLPLPVTDVTPTDNKLGASENPPLYGFTVHDSIDRLDGLNCFASGRGEVTIKEVMNGRIEVRLDKPFPEGRARINCTLMGPDGRWRWFGNQFYVAGD
jgi:peptidoglycan/xylan/chitin deacetylase (PgdA/CDA1 family)